MDYIIVLLAFCFLILPGLLLGPALFRRSHGLFGALIIGAGIGFVILIDTNTFLSLVSQIDAVKLSMFISIISIAALVILSRSINIKEIHGRWPWGILFIIAGGIMIRIIPLFKSAYPLGWDTTFHLLIARAILCSGEVPTTWEPFERFALNYPWGSHILMANINLVTGVPLHVIFSACVSIIFSALSIGAIYVLAGSLGWNQNTRLGAAFAYSFLANAGSLDYFRWGGLPNQLGMFLFLVALAVFLSDSPSRISRLGLSGFILSGVVLTHHHSMITVFGVVLFVAAVACLARQKLCSIGTDTLIVVTVSLIASFWQSWRLLSRFGQVGQVGVMRFKETLNIFETPFVDGGILLAITATMGFYMIYKDRKDGVLFLHGWAASLFAAFTIGYYGWKIYTRIAWGDSFVAMTPSRFLTDLAYPLSLYSGLFIGRLFVAHGRQSIYRNILLSLMVMTSAYYVMFQMHPPLLAADVEAMSWLKTNSSRNALIINEGNTQTWVPYISDREVTSTAIPISEHEDKYKSDKSILADIITGKRNIDDSDKILKIFADRDIYLYTPKNMHSPGLKEVFKNRAAHIYYFDPGE